MTLIKIEKGPKRTRKGGSGGSGGYSRVRIFEDLFISAGTALKTDPGTLLGAKTVLAEGSKIKKPPHGPSHGYGDMQGTSYLRIKPHLKPTLPGRPLLMNETTSPKITPGAKGQV